jgi:hypothetical protein
MQLAFDFYDADSRAKPVELLRDGRGIYGIGVSDSFDYEALAWSCGIEPNLWEHEYPGALILRPDRLDGTKPRNAVLQKITGGVRRAIFRNSIEARLRQLIHHEALRRAGLPWPPPSGQRWWSADKKQQTRNRGTYHGLRLLSLSIINNLIGKALEGAADADAVRAARRFSFWHRECIYRAGARSRRALQLTETFPVLAAMIYSNCQLPVEANLDFFAATAATAARKKSATDLVERGARLRDVALALGVPMALRCIKPGAAHLVSKVFCHHPELLHFMPGSLPRARIWLRVVDWAHRTVDADFARWAALNVPQIPGRLEQVGSFLGDIADWVRAGQREASEQQFVARPFKPSMSLRTVTALSADWHEAVASQMDGPQFAFPAPWYPAGKIGSYEILPIDNSAELYREGSAMHHCVGTYASEVKQGYTYVYSVRCDGKRLATLALARNGPEPDPRRAALIQIRGPCNAEPPKETLSKVQTWLRAQPPLPLPEWPVPWAAP